MSKVKFKFHPMSRRVHELMMRAYDGDPAQCYADLLTATVMSATFMDLPNDTIHQHVALIRSNCNAAIAAHPEVFGDKQECQQPGRT